MTRMTHSWQECHLCLYPLCQWQQFSSVQLLSRVWLLATPWIAAWTHALNLSQHQGLFKWVSSLHQVTKVLEFQLQYPSSVQFSSVAQSCLTLCDPMNRSTPGLPVHHQLPELTQTHVHWVSEAIQPSHPLSPPSPPAPNPSQHQGLFQWVNSSDEVAIVLKLQLQHKSFQWTPRTNLL